jgi:cation diffusion facilitator CzcD-associated flavoprotein CzcO
MNHVRVAIVGTGFAGLGAAIALAREGVDYAVLERAHDVGGTWRDNTYPGCRCDVPSHLYSFSFAPNPEWTETYSPQPEIRAYLRRTAEDHGVMDKVRFGHEVLSASWDAGAQRWQLDTAAGPLTADVVLLGNGPLAEPSLPDIPGLGSFAGAAFHSARWRHDYDVAGKRIAVIGTGASAIQFVPEIRKTAAQVTVFQRTPPWVLPHSNRRITGFERMLYRRVPALQRVPRAFVYWSRELFVTGLLRNSRMLARLEAVARRHLERQVRDPELRAKVMPDYRPGCKRLLLSNDWYPALQAPNVDLVTEKIVGVTPSAVVTADGVEHEVDAIIFGTGFHVVDNPVADRVIGADGRSLAERWAATGVTAYNGTAVDGFPNLFMLAGPNTGIGHTSLVVMIEAQLAYVADALRYMGRTGAGRVEVRRPVVQKWSDEVQRKAARTVWNSGGCASWYLDAEGRNTTIWPDYTFRFVRRTKRFDPSKYEVTARLREADTVEVS